MVAEIFAFDRNVSYKLRTEKLKENGIALWDVLESCERDGAADRNIQNPLPNDFKIFFKQYSNLTKVLFNGHKAENLFNTFCEANDFPRIEFVYLPSTSPANAAIPYEVKLDAWRDGFVL